MDKEREIKEKKKKPITLESLKNNFEGY